MQRVIAKKKYFSCKLIFKQGKHENFESAEKSVQDPSYSRKKYCPKFIASKILECSHIPELLCSGIYLAVNI